MHWVGNILSALSIAASFNAIIIAMCFVMIPAIVSTCRTPSRDCYPLFTRPRQDPRTSGPTPTSAWRCCFYLCPSRGADLAGRVHVRPHPGAAPSRCFRPRGWRLTHGELPARHRAANPGGRSIARRRRLLCWLTIARRGRRRTTARRPWLPVESQSSVAPEDARETLHMSIKPLAQRQRCSHSGTSKNASCGSPEVPQARLQAA